MYRKILDAARMTIEVFLVHPGGPFFKNRDNVWSIPKGLQENGEDLLATAKREFEEETNIVILERSDRIFFDLNFVEYNNKRVYCWAFENNITDEEIKKVFKCNFSKFGWPENDEGEFFDIETAKLKIFPGQLPFLERLVLILLS